MHSHTLIHAQPHTHTDERESQVRLADEVGTPLRSACYMTHTHTWLRPIPKMTSRAIRHVIPRIQRVVIGSGFMWPAFDASSIDESGVMIIPAFRALGLDLGFSV